MKLLLLHDYCGFNSNTLLLCPLLSEPIAREEQTVRTRKESGRAGGSGPYLGQAHEGAFPLGVHLQGPYQLLLGPLLTQLLLCEEISPLGRQAPPLLPTLLHDGLLLLQQGTLG